MGSAWGYLPVLFDLAYETKGATRFSIWQNMRVEEPNGLFLTNTPYEVIVHQPGAEISGFETEDALLGVTGPLAKHTVYTWAQSIANLTSSHFHALIHPRSYCATSAIIGFGVIAEPGVIISSETLIGFGVSLKRGVCIGHHNAVGDFTEFNPGVITSSNVIIGRGCILGAGAIIKDGITIGDNTFIGMGSLVNKNIPSGVIAYGSPCKVIRENDRWAI